MSILTISGSPSSSSRSNRVLGYVREQFALQGIATQHIDLRSLPSQALLLAQEDDPAIVAALAQVEEADTIIVATPVYKAAYSGLLKVFLDLLPQSGLREKLVLPIATGGSLAHALIIDYALRPVLASLAPAQILPGIFAVDQHIEWDEDAGLHLNAALVVRLQESVSRISQVHALRHSVHQVIGHHMLRVAPSPAPLGTSVDALQ